jgi:glycosyltransferase involved in cell wall biosynthesis
VVCYCTGGQRDFLHDGETGYVVTTNDRRTFAERCAELVRRPDRRVAIGRANRARARDYFIDRCAERYEALFESVLRSKAADYAPGPVRCAAPGSENGASCVATRE